MQLDESLDGASDDWRDEVATTIAPWTSRRAREPKSQTDLEWYYAVDSAATDLGLRTTDGPTFTCDACGRLADVLDAAHAASESWWTIDRGYSSLRQVLRNAILDGETIRPSILQSYLDWSFEDASDVLVDAERRGLLSRKGTSYTAAPPLCDLCYEVRAGVASEAPPTARPVNAPRVSIPPQMRFRVLQRDAFRCQYCGRTAASGATLHLDHVVPVAAGGLTTEDNFITACDSCNLGKSDMGVIG